MRVPHALAAVAAIGALTYGFADPLNSALTATTRARESTASAATAAAAATVKVRVPSASHAARLGGSPIAASAVHRLKTMVQPDAASHPGLAAGPRLTPAPPQTAPHVSESGLAEITKARDAHRTAVRRSEPSPSASSDLGKTVTPAVISTEELYGSGINQRLTVSRLSTASGRRPTVYFVHGGSWIAGGQGEWAGEAHRWAAKGWTAVNISYRLNVRGRYMLSDIRTVVSAFERRSYVDPKRQILVGSSAGAHLATSIAVRYPQEFRGVIAWSPVISPEAASNGMQLTAAGSKFRLAQAARRLWGPNWRSATPVSYVTNATPPLWAAAAREEWLRWSDQGELLCQALGDRCTATIVPGRSHGAQLADTHAELRNRALNWAVAQVS